GAEREAEPLAELLAEPERGDPERRDLAVLRLERAAVEPEELEVGAFAERGLEVGAQGPREPVAREAGLDAAAVGDGAERARGEHGADRPEARREREVEAVGVGGVEVLERPRRDAGGRIEHD